VTGEPEHRQVQEWQEARWSWYRGSTSRTTPLRLPIVDSVVHLEPLFLAEASGCDHLVAVS
jgi:hypothetical protein